MERSPDGAIRTFITKKYADSAVARVQIERTANRVIIDVFTSKPGMLIGAKGAGVEEMKKELIKLTNNKNISVNIKEVKRPDLDADLVAQSIAQQLERRVSFRRAMKQAMGRVMRAGAKGCKVMVSGRLDGAEIARSEHYHEGRLPLHTLRADIDYALAEAHTTFGVIGVKVWICQGEILGKKAKNETPTTQEGGNE